MSKLYAKAKAEYDRLPHVNDDDMTLDGTIDHLVFRAQHELDLEDEGENEYIGYVVPRADYVKIQKFVNKWKGK
jgi:hypothetical protein